MSTVTTKNYKVRAQFAKDIVERMGMDEIRHYKKRFGRKTAQTIYKHGWLDCDDYDLYKTLVELGVNTKPVKEYSKVLDWGCTYKHRENIRKEYVKAIEYALPLVEAIKRYEDIKVALTEEEINEIRKIRKCFSESDRLYEVENYFLPKIKQDPLRFDGETMLSIYKLAGL